MRLGLDCVSSSWSTQCPQGHVPACPSLTVAFRTRCTPSSAGIQCKHSSAWQAATGLMAGTMPGSEGQFGQSQSLILVACKPGLTWTIVNSQLQQWLHIMTAWRAILNVPVHQTNKSRARPRPPVIDSPLAPRTPGARGGALWKEPGPWSTPSKQPYAMPPTFKKPLASEFWTGLRHCPLQNVDIKVTKGS